MEVSAIRRASIPLACAAVAALLAVPAASSAATVTSVAKGLDNPRAVAFDADGHLFVAEAGHGGGECLKGGPGGPQEETCVGFTSGVSKIENGVKPPSVDLARRCDTALNGAGELAGRLPETRRS